MPPAGCEPSTSYRWDGFTCAFERSCREACRGTDCDALYADRASCLAEHASCPGYDCEHDPEGTLKSLLDQHRSCATDADCAIVDTTCCSRYANSGIFEHDYQFLLRQAQYCFMGETGMYGGCLVLCPTLAPPACVNGLCAAPPQAQ